MPHLQSSLGLCCNPEASLTSVIQPSFEINGRWEASEPLSANTTGSSRSPLLLLLTTPACKCQLVQQRSVQAENFVSFNATGHPQNTLHQPRPLQTKKKTHYITRKKWINPFWRGETIREVSAQQLDRHKDSQLHTNSSLILQQQLQPSPSACSKLPSRGTQHKAFQEGNQMAGTASAQTPHLKL